MLIKILESEYLTGDGEVENYLEMFRDVYIFGIHVYRKVLNSTNRERMSKFFPEHRKRIGFDCDEKNGKSKS